MNILEKISRFCAYGRRMTFIPLPRAFPSETRLINVKKIAEPKYVNRIKKKKLNHLATPAELAKLPFHVVSAPLAPGT